MTSLFHKKLNDISKLSLKKPLKIKPISNLKKITKYNHSQENQKNISININSKEEYLNNYRISTLSTGTREKSKTKYETLFPTNHTLRSRKKNKNNYINNLFKNTLFTTKIILRPKTALKSRARGINYTNTNKKIINAYKYNGKSAKNNKIKGFPLNFIQSMRLNLKQSISKADEFLKKEKNRLLKENPKIKFQLKYNKRQKQKKDALEKIMKYKKNLASLKTNKKQYYINELNNHNAKLLLNENTQYFKYVKPIIDRKKFDSKYRLLTDNDIKVDETKYKDIRDIRKIFSKYLDDDSKINKERLKNGQKLSKEKIYQRFKLIIKKCAIEFKNIIIPFNEYRMYFHNSKKVIEYLFNEDYLKLIKMIKSENCSNNDKKDKDVINFITKNKFLIYTMDFYGQNIMFFIVKYKLYKSLSKIIQFGSNVNHQDFNGRTALHFASKNNDITAVTILLYFLANPSIKDTNNKIPLDYTKNNGDDSYIIKELLIKIELIRKFNKYHSWKEYEIYIRRGIQYHLNQNLSKERYELIFSFIDSVNLYYS